MNNHKFNQLPHIDTMRIGDHVIIEESVFGGNPLSPRHMGERYTRCEVMSEGGMVNSVKLKVIDSVGANAIHVGSIITRPILNVLNKGRKVIIQPIVDAMPKFKEGGLNDLYVGDVVNHKGVDYEVGGITDCHNFVKAKNVSSGENSEIDIDDFMDNSTLIKRK